MIIPFQEIQPDTLQAICEDWLTRQAQEWLGDTEERDQAVKSVIQALENNKLFISWDEEMNSLDIVDAEQLALIQSTSNTEFGS